MLTTVAGASIGRWASGRALRPLAQVSPPETVAGGSLDTRLLAEGDPELSALASSFNRMTDALRERIDHEVRFTADVSHELRSPLTTLATSLGVLIHRDELPPRSRPRSLDLLSAELHRFQGMVDDLLEISRVDTGSAELSLDEVEVGELARQAAAAAVAGGVPVDVDTSVAGVRLWVDKRRIERVVTNLVDNAEQYAGGVSRLAVEPGPDGRVRFVVADRGPGVAPAERDRIFERFYRGQASASGAWPPVRGWASRSWPSTSGSTADAYGRSGAPTARTASSSSCPPGTTKEATPVCLPARRRIPRCATGASEP